MSVAVTAGHAAVLTVCCDGVWQGGMPCRANAPTRASSVHVARTLAESYGWSCDADGDLCPACSRFAPPKAVTA